MLLCRVGIGLHCERIERTGFFNCHRHCGGVSLQGCFSNVPGKARPGFALSYARRSATTLSLPLARLSR